MFTITDPSLIVFQYALHLIPGLSMLLSYSMLDVRLKATHAKPLVVILAIYCLLNCVVTHHSGSPVHEWMHWQDYTTIFVVTVLEIAFTFTYMVMTLVSFKLKPPKAAKVVSNQTSARQAT
jgi:hypothetical protein